MSFQRPGQLQVLSYQPADLSPPQKWGRAFIVPLMCMIASWVFGAATNLVSGILSLEYFQEMVGWMYGRMALHHVVMQGLFESSFFGVLLALVVTITYCASTRARCPLVLVGFALGGGMLVALICWLIGGAIGLTGRLQPPLHSLPQKEWVRGSIFGAYAGGLAATVLCPVLMHGRWKRWRKAFLKGGEPPAR